MGQTLSAAAANPGENVKELGKMMALMGVRLEAMLLELQLQSGSDAPHSSTEVTGGRAILRTSETRVRSNAEIEDQLEDAIVSFYETAQASTGTKPKYAAVQGAKKLLSAHISTVLLQPGRETAQASSFVVLFMNNSLVRVDYYLYGFNNGDGLYGTTVAQGAVAIVLEVTVLDIAELTVNEIDYLLSQSLQTAPGTADWEIVIQIKLNLVSIRSLSLALKKVNIGLEDIESITALMGKTTRAISDAVAKLKDYDDPTAL